MERELPEGTGKLKTDSGLSAPRRVTSRTEKNTSNKNYTENAEAMFGWLQLEPFSAKKESGSAARQRCSQVPLNQFKLCSACKEVKNGGKALKYVRLPSEGLRAGEHRVSEVGVLSGEEANSCLNCCQPNIQRVNVGPEGAHWHRSYEFSKSNTLKRFSPAGK